MIEFFMIYRTVQRRIENLEWLGFRYDQKRDAFVRKQEMLTPDFIRNASISDWCEALDRITSRT